MAKNDKDGNSEEEEIGGRVLRGWIGPIYFSFVVIQLNWERGNCN